jgi:hypothetical protein
MLPIKFWLICSSDSRREDSNVQTEMLEEVDFKKYVLERLMEITKIWQ